MQILPPMTKRTVPGSGYGWSVFIRSRPVARRPGVASGQPAVSIVAGVPSFSLSFPARTPLARHRSRRPSVRASCVEANDGSRRRRYRSRATDGGGVVDRWFRPSVRPTFGRSVGRRWSFVRSFVRSSSGAGRAAGRLPSFVCVRCVRCVGGVTTLRTSYGQANGGRTRARAGRSVDVTAVVCDPRSIRR